MQTKDFGPTAQAAFALHEMIEHLGASEAITTAGAAAYKLVESVVNLEIERDAYEQQTRVRLDQFQFCIDQVAHALGDVCCGGVDSPPEEQLADTHSTTRVLCDAIYALKKDVEHAQSVVMANEANQPKI